jgi:hypothetical protein
MKSTLIDNRVIFVTIIMIIIIWFNFLLICWHNNHKAYYGDIAGKRDNTVTSNI